MFYALFIRQLTHELSFSARLKLYLRAYDLFWIYESQA